MTSTRASGFKSAKELREILDAVLREVDADPIAGAKLRGAAAPLRIEFPDLKLAVNIGRAERRGFVAWDFKRTAKAPPKLRLSMDSDTANRLFQGRENPAIAIARGHLRPTVTDAGAALRFFGAMGPVYASYRGLVAERYPHLVLD